MAQCLHSSLHLECLCMVSYAVLMGHPKPGLVATVLSSKLHHLQDKSILTKNDCPRPPLLHVLPQRYEKQKAEDSTPHQLLVQVTLHITAYNIAQAMHVSQ